MDIDKIIAEVERLDREATRGWFASKNNGVWGNSPYVVNQHLLVFSLNPAYARDTAQANVEMAALGRTAAPLLAAEVRRLRAELVECRQARDAIQAFLSSTSESLDKARAELRAKYSPDAMDLVGQRLVNARKSLDPDAPIWLTAAMDEAWGVLAFLRRNGAQQAARIERQDDELAKLRDQILDYQQQLHIAEQEIARLKGTMVEPTEQTGDEDSEQ